MHHSTNPDLPDRLPGLHWQPTDLDLETLSARCRSAPALGVASVWIDRVADTDALLAAEWLAMTHEALDFTVVVRADQLSPVTFVQQVNTVSAVIGGRIRVALDARAQHGRSASFLRICRALWYDDPPVSCHDDWFHIENARLGTPFMAPDRSAPLIYLIGEPCGVPVDCVWAEGDVADARAARGRLVRPSDSIRCDGVDHVCLIGGEIDALIPMLVAAV